MRDEQSSDAMFLICHTCPTCNNRWNKGWGAPEDYEESLKHKHRICPDCLPITPAVKPRNHDPKDAPHEIHLICPRCNVRWHGGWTTKEELDATSAVCPRCIEGSRSKKDERLLRNVNALLNESDKKHKKEYAEGTMAIIRADEISGFNLLPNAEEILQDTYNHVMDSDHIQGIDAIQAVFVKAVEDGLESRGQTNGDSI